VDINKILFSLMAMPAEQYLSKESMHYSRFVKNIKPKNHPLERKIIKSNSIDSILNNTIKKVRKYGNLEEPLLVNKNIDNTPGFFTYAMQFVSEFKTNVKNLYSSIIKYAKSKYKSEKPKKNIRKDCWQIGIDISTTCNFFFFPKKEKKVIGQLIDKGILFDYINPSPTLCYF